MTDHKSLASALLFAGSALCFFFPFVAVSCGGVEAFTLTGQQLATGTTLSQPEQFGPPQKQHIDADPFAAIAGLCALVGIVLSITGRTMASGRAVAAGAGAVSLIMLRSHLNGELQSRAGGMVQANYQTGYTLALVLLVAGAIWNVFMFLQSRRTAASEVGIQRAESS